MKQLHQAIALGVFLSLTTPSWAADSCAQIRAEINAQLGPLAEVNVELLKKISGRTDCRFTASEVYRAAYGERPIVRDESRESRQHRDRDDD